MKNETILLRIDSTTKTEIMKLADSERRSMTSLILNLIDKKIARVKNGI